MQLLAPILSSAKMEKHIQEKHIQKLCPTTAGTVSEASTDAASKEINEKFLVQKPCPAAA